MGGNAFGTPAARLTIAEYEALSTHILSRLDAFGPVDTVPHLSSKSSHGDIDVLVGWDKAAWENAKGQGMGRVKHKPSKDSAQKGGDRNGDTSLRSALAAAAAADVTFASPRRELTIWCGTIAAHIGGTHWHRSGGEVSVAVPHSTVRDAVEAHVSSKPLLAASAKLLNEMGDTGSKELHHRTPPVTRNLLRPSPGDMECSGNEHLFSDLQPHSFVQVDLIFIPHDGVRFQRFVYGYGVTLLLLSQLMRHASSCRDFVLQGHRAILRWTPYPGCPKAEVQLTQDASALCEYLGLSYEKWEHLKPATTEDLFAWLADCAQDSRAARGLRRIAQYGLVSGTYKRRGPRNRVHMLDEFGEWLRGHGWMLEGGEKVATDTKDRQDRQGTQDMQSTQDAKDTQDEKDTKSETEKNGVGPPTSRDELEEQPLSRVHPDSPRPLPSCHTVLLRYWGKEAEYTAAVEAIRPLAEQHWAGGAKRKARADTA
ncbi:hypothetical protein CspeluHIS016_0702700 [Cutaneotrichosporon spelunceum]|uniref:Uncharacterized protein n=1 Tax=Cutaneotrichosporon spelunceum TaxID=1672016 RepID=A0AAD3YDI9_9TREE|nr:hypothetical protein CspeluHIS016_0702700 [Cutaneotrichosporon spelunceum]